jgi:uroporphyrin-III C-methyltransferase/precorrin-2 dehydrogenase/sirohydrochlorin ferrochelatase
MTISENFLPTELPVAGRLVAVIGHGPAAAVTAAALLEQGARVRVVAGRRADLTPSLADLAARSRIELVCSEYAAAVLDGAWLVYPRTGDRGLDRQISRDAQRARIWCIEPPTSVPRHAGEAGRVSIVGGGPGDPGLITVRGRQVLASADVVIHDRLAPLSLLAGLPSSTVLIDAAKLPGGTAMAQADINSHLLEHASQGKHVVRLKGGDPFVFGRGMEEVDACTAAGIPVEVVPGVSSATGVPALAGISLTHRGVAHAFTVVSGHLAPESDRSQLDWAAMARSGATLVLMMAVETLPSITSTLIAAGMDPSTPAATVQDGASARQAVVPSVLGRLAQDAAGVRPPAVTVIGPMAGRLADVSGSRLPEVGDCRYENTVAAAVDGKLA